ncbi:hypothetical protein PCANB_001388 [Pneumocystis canis]|nr:hypothetical protein PCK1_001442 [Pneumocystis canis]KAG5439090.1 hypothetical protein PCANB_001388 [Pneumocystis canis]
MRLGSTKMAGKSVDITKNPETHRSQRNSNNIPTYFSRFPRKSYSGRYGVPLVITKASSVVDAEESEINEELKDMQDVSKVENTMCCDNLSIVEGKDDIFENTNINELETNVQDMSDKRLSSLIESSEEQTHIPCELDQAIVFSTSAQVEWNGEGSAFLPAKESPGTRIDQEVTVLHDENACRMGEIVNSPSPSLYETYIETGTSQEQNIEKKQVDHDQQYVGMEENGDKGVLEVSGDISYDSLKDDKIVQQETCNYVTLDSDTSAYNNSPKAQVFQSEHLHLTQEPYISLTAYPKDNMLPPPLPDDFSDQERTYAVLSIKEWEDKGLEISKRGFQLIEKVIFLRKRKEELLLQVQNMIDIHAEKLIQREENLRLRALDVRKRGKELLDEVSLMQLNI